MMLSQPEVSQHHLASPTARLLAWYDVHKRALPWRVVDGRIPDPYHIWLSEVMLQQTTVATVIPYFEAFLRLFPTLQALSEAPLERVLGAWAGLGYYSRAHNLHKCAQTLMRDYNGEFPQSAQELRKLSGIGDYTSAAIAAIAFQEPIVAVDGNVERVISRFYALDTPLPAGKPVVRQKAQALMPLTTVPSTTQCGDFVQALMELGATVCTPKNPVCSQCPWHKDCAAYAQGAQTHYPIKTVKKPAQKRFGIAYVATRSNGNQHQILLRTRALTGLLGGMAEVPTTDWTSKNASEPVVVTDESMPFGDVSNLKWQTCEGQVKHVFTHITLLLSVKKAHLASDTPPPDGMRWVNISALNREPLSTLMQKVLKHANIGGI